MDKILKKNFIYLFVLQNANYIIPLLLLPYLAHTLGAGNYGKVAFVQAFMSYFALFTDFGFNTSSTQSISKVRNDKNSISNIFWNTIYAKSIFAAISLIVLVITLLVISKLQKDVIMFFIAYFGVISNVLYPMWLFQGIEKMSIITILTVIPKIFVLVFTFLFVNNSEDYILALFIQVCGTILTALLSLMVVIYKKMVIYVKPNLNSIWLEIQGSWPIFMSGLATNIYTTTNIVVLGFLTNDATVGVFSAADKIIRAIISVSSAVTQVTFPRINVYYLVSKEKALSFAKKILKIVSSVNLIGAFVLIIASPIIVKYMFGVPEYNESILLMRISSFMPLFATCNGIIAVNILVTFNLKKYLAWIVSTGGLFSIIMVFPLTYFFQAEGVAVCALLTEILITILLIIKLKQLSLNIFN